MVAQVFVICSLLVTQIKKDISAISSLYNSLSVGKSQRMLTLEPVFE